MQLPEVASRTCTPLHQLQPQVRPLEIVVVDDDADFVETTCQLLRTWPGVEIAAAGSNGIEAVRLAKLCQPDVLLMDVNMPELDGPGAAKLISQACPSTRIILMSGDDSPEVRQRCLQSGAQAFVPKFVLCREIREKLALEQKT